MIFELGIVEAHDVEQFIYQKTQQSVIDPYNDACR